MINIPIINIDTQPMIEQLQNEKDSINEEQKTDLHELEDIVKSRKKRMEDTIEKMKGQIDDHKNEFKEFRDEWNKHDATWKKNHLPEFQRRTAVFLSDIEAMEAAVLKYGEDTLKEITKFFNKKQQDIIKRTNERIRDIEKQLNGITSEAETTISDTLKNLKPPINIPI